MIASFTSWKGLDGPLAQGESPSNLNAVSLLLFVAVCIGVGYVALTAQRRPRVAQLCFLLVAGFLLTNKVWSPQYSLWLVPLAVLALPHRRLLLAWMTIDALVWVPRMMYYLGVSNKGLPEQWFTGTVVIRDIAVLVLCALVLRQIYPAVGGSRAVRVHRRSGGRCSRSSTGQTTCLATRLAEAVQGEGTGTRHGLRSPLVEGGVPVLDRAGKQCCLRGSRPPDVAVLRADPSDVCVDGADA